MSLIHTGNDVILNFPLLKVGEKIIIDMFAKANAPLKELSNSDSVDEFLKCDYRIVNLKKIETKQRKERFITGSSFFYLCLVVMYSIFLIKFTNRGEERAIYTLCGSLIMICLAFFLFVCRDVRRIIKNKI